MIVRSCAILCLLISIGLAAELDKKRRNEPTISECAAKGGECDETKGRPVCGTDDKTYPSRCHLLRVQCSGHQVSLKHRGPCKECLEARAYALKHKLHAKSPSKFIPKCRSDGTYASVQCLDEHGCWCSDSSGKPIPNTTIRNGKPNCREYSRSNNRRSPPRGIGPSRRGKICSQLDQAMFNTNLIKVFQSEYSRVHLQATAPHTNSVTDKNILDWKFSGLDLNSNQMLDKQEYRELKRLVKKVIKPKRCARAFGKFCDIDQDERLSLLEWSNCLSRDGINRHAASVTGHSQPNHQHQPQPSSIAHHRHHSQSHNLHPPVSLDGIISDNDGDGEDDDESSQHLGDYSESDDYSPDDSEDDYNVSYNPFDSRTTTNLSSAVTHIPSIYYLRPKSVTQEPTQRVSDGESDCLADRAAAQVEESNGIKAWYMPECTADGRYQRVQCYRSTGYCWCVHEDTGKNIPGTTVKDKRPQCDSISRPMKGCPDQKKTDFLKELKEFLKNQVGSNGNTGANNTNWTSEDEKIATLSFVLLDKNKNKIWERKEWKAFRDLVTASQSLRKCGKKLPRHCDVNSDKEITLSEWLNCLDAQRIEPTKPAQSNSKLNGPNPLESYLKE